MNGFLRLLLIVLVSGSMIRCATGEGDFQSEGGVSDSDFAQFDAPAEPQATPDEAIPEEAPEAAPQASEQPAPPSEGDPLDQEFAIAEETAPAEPAQAEPTAPPADELALEDEFSQFDQAPAEEAPVAVAPAVEEAPPVDEPIPAPLDEPVPPPAIAEEAPPAADDAPLTLDEPLPSEPLVAQTEEEFPPPAVDLPPDPAPEPAPVADTEQQPPPEIPSSDGPVMEVAAEKVDIKNIRYKPNDRGGTVSIEASGPVTFSTRKNPDTNQLVVEIPNASLPKRLKRPFNTKDMRGGIGSVDAYQNSGSTTARIVIQLRKGAEDPIVQAEGNSILVVEGSGASGEAKLADGQSAEGAVDDGTGEESEATAQSRILSTQSLDEFLAGSTQFFGKKISVETTDMDIRDVIKLISEESGINLVLSEDVKGTVNVKLRQVPWDQALVVIMKMKKLGYTRAGNILRITSLAELKAEEDESVRQNNAKKAQVALKVRVVPVSYAKIDDIVTQIKAFLSDRGKVVGDNRTSSLVISDLDENIERAIKLIGSIDVPPLQVLIEGKVVEASDNFQRSMGINWSAPGRPSAFGKSSRGDIKTLTSVTQSTASGGGTFGVNFQMGTLDLLGDLNASLSLLESQDMVKVLSSPRIVTLHNEPAEINQVTQIPIVTSTLTSGGPPQQSVSFKDVKLKLGVTPQITNDAAVIMGVDVVREFLGGTQDKETGAVPINSRTAKTKVMVKNGQTAVIGGIYQSDSQIGESRVPWLADIPLFGWLFKSKDTKNQKNELLIFLTPRILGQADSQTIPSSEGELQ
jgi:type IV pilus assembly protein PilQ